MISRDRALILELYRAESSKEAMFIPVTLALLILELLVVGRRRGAATGGDEPALRYPVGPDAAGAV